MLNLNIPGREQLEIKHLVLDFNGTIAVDGVLESGVEDRIHLLSKQLEIHVTTADTNGSVANQCSDCQYRFKFSVQETIQRKKENLCEVWLARSVYGTALMMLRCLKKQMSASR